MTPQIDKLPSPNHDARPADTPIDMLILHYTGMRSCEEAIARLRDPTPPTGTPVASHYVVTEDGTVYQLVDEARRAWHAGISHWRGHDQLNGRSIGIEICNPGHEWGYRDFPPAQIAAVIFLGLGIVARHPIPPRNVVGHSDVAPTRKQDPGERFPWAELAQAGLGLWPDMSSDAGDTTPANPLRAALLRLGYGPAPDEALVTAFQRHWRPERVDGRADRGTEHRLHALLRLSD